MGNANFLSSSPSERDRPLVTMFVMGYNQEEGIENAIMSAFSQTYEPLEIILADDGSADKTFQIMEALAAGYEGPHMVATITGPNRGVVGNVNRVMEQAKGDLIVQNNGDDISEPDRVERIVDHWLRSGRSIKCFHSARKIVDEEGGYIGICRGPHSLAQNPTPEHIAKHHMAACGATAAWSSEIFEIFGPLPDYALVEDSIIPFRASLLGEVSYIDEPLVTWRIGGVSSTVMQSGYTGHAVLYGFQLEWAKRHLANCRSFLSDIESVSYDRKDQILRHMRKFMRPREFQVSLSERNALGRLAMLPLSLMYSLLYRDTVFLKRNMCYLFEKTYCRYKDMQIISGASSERNRERLLTELGRKYRMEF